MPSSDVHIELPERYRVVRHVANGGMASVWSAEDSILGRLVAVKVLARHVAADPSARTRFEREARTAARVSDHPNVATIYDVGEHESVPFIVMELLTGGTVGDRLRTGPSSGAGGIPRPRAMTWLEQAAAALDYAHGEGIVHRDIKPANLLLDERERLAVGDFGIARVAEDSNLTQAGQVLGTAAYLSPEQALGQPATAASDRYSLAVVAYELLCGRRPFQGDHIAAQARQHIEGEVPESELGAEVDEVLRRGMAKEPDDRYPTASRLVDELRAVVGRASPPPTEATRRIAAAAAPVPAPTPTPVPAPASAPALTAPPRRREPVPAPPAAAAAAPARSDSGRSRRSLLAVAGVLALVLAIAAVALLAGGGNGGEERAAAPSTSTEQTQAADPPATPSEQAPAPAAPEAPAETAPDNEPEGGAGPDTSGNESPSQLDARGYELLQSGDPEGAIPVLQQAVAGFESQGDSADSTGYGYALFNLGTAYAATGNHADAIPLFERRLQISPNDRPGQVRRALREAERQAGGGGGSGGDDDDD